MSLTVGIVTRNAEWCLPNCIRTLKAQEVQPDEYTICIGKSSDKTEEIVKNFAKNIGVPVNIIYDNEGIGTGFARKSVVESSTKDYIYWVDSDVILPKNIIKFIYFLIEKYKFDTFNVTPNYGTRQINVKQAKEMYEKNQFPKLINLDKAIISTIKPRNVHIFKRQIVLDAGNYDPFFKRGQDEDIDIRLNFLGIKSITSQDFFYLHYGVLDQYNKMLISQVFIKFLYKYGIRFAFFGGDHTEQFLAYLVRTAFLISFISIFVCLFIGQSPLLSIISSVGILLALFFGVSLRYGFKPKLYVMQFFKCFGEYYALYMMLKYKNLDKFGYGWKQIQRLINIRDKGVKYV
jgi:glycosyltransferase involved in cell wall biosynthesis